MSDNEKILMVKQLIDGARESLNTAAQMLNQVTGGTDLVHEKASHIPHAEISAESAERVVEGIFDGQHMIDAESKVYTVPANYASKSKLIEGDKLKLVITKDGKFIYKQTGPIARKRVVGKIIKDEVTQEFRAEAEGHIYHVLVASITYFKGQEGDEIVLLVPEGPPTKWAAVENIIKAGHSSEITPMIVEEKKETV